MRKKLRRVRFVDFSITPVLGCNVSCASPIAAIMRSVNDVSGDGSSSKIVVDGYNMLVSASYLPQQGRKVSFQNDHQPSPLRRTLELDA